MDFDDPQVLVTVRIAYVAVQALILATYYYVSYKVRGRKRTLLSRIVLTQKWVVQIKAKNDLTVLKYGA